MPLQNLSELLRLTAATYPEKGITVYPPGGRQQAAVEILYPELLQRAKHNACLIRYSTSHKPNSIILLHFDNHLENIVWYWSAVIAGRLPAISTPLSKDLEQRNKHILHLNELLGGPTCITTRSLVSEFAVQDSMYVQTIEELHAVEKPCDQTYVHPGAYRIADDLATLMLTSGSTGNAKAVGLSHGQILRAVSGKSEHHSTSCKDVFFNWIGMDHVANLTEIHLHAMSVGANQVHVQAADLLSDPYAFVEFLHFHKVSYTFSPNFFLASLERVLESVRTSHTAKLDLASLRCLISGGEANVVETCIALTKTLAAYGAPQNVITPGFGMTETCAGSIYGKNCPRYDASHNYEFASLGTCIPGIQMRVTAKDGSNLPPNRIGSLEVTGPIVFTHYYNNSIATADAFTHDGWFITGDLAFIDCSGQLNLAGRAKESIIINGINYYPHELETAIEEAAIAGACQGYTAVFPYRRKGSPTEDICVVYLPTYEPEDIESRGQTNYALIKVLVLATGARPFKVIPLGSSLLQKSTLGKLSRTKIRGAFERGEYESYELANDRGIETYRAALHESPVNETEVAILDIVTTLFDVPKSEVGVNTSILELGVSSIELIKLKRELESMLHTNRALEIITLITNPTVRALALKIQDDDKPDLYSPTVILQDKGSKTPLWLVHPGVGEVLVFLSLGKYITDRPVYALRARGFGPGETFFHSIEEAVASYIRAIKDRQPEGPYAIAGYSYGAILAFEIAKVLERYGDQVRFLGSFNLPPHIKFRMRQLDWTEVLLNLSYFLDLISEAHAHKISPELHGLSRPEALSHLISIASQSRMKELDMDEKKLSNWAELAHRLQAMARDYEPSGRVASIDVFCAIPLAAVASSKDDWVANHLSKWNGFSAAPPRLHHVDGSHYTMLGPEHIVSFQKLLRRVLADRGL
ncbi:hypothetical protein MMC11_001102 [Xylographa trunciseda]|nr:hypothetical protein [Xylographa trunciseda]